MFTSLNVVEDDLLLDFDSCFLKCLKPGGQWWNLNDLGSQFGVVDGSGYIHVAFLLCQVFPIFVREKVENFQESFPFQGWTFFFSCWTCAINPSRIFWFKLKVFLLFWCLMFLSQCIFYYTMEFIDTLSDTIGNRHSKCKRIMEVENGMGSFLYRSVFYTRKESFDTSFGKPKPRLSLEMEEHGNNNCGGDLAENQRFLKVWYWRSVPQKL